MSEEIPEPAKAVAPTNQMGDSAQLHMSARPPYSDGPLTEELRGIFSVDRAAFGNALAAAAMIGTLASADQTLARERANLEAAYRRISELERDRSTCREDYIRADSQLQTLRETRPLSETCLVAGTTIAVIGAEGLISSQTNVFDAVAGLRWGMVAFGVILIVLSLVIGRGGKIK